MKIHSFRIKTIECIFNEFSVDESVGVLFAVSERVKGEGRKVHAVSFEFLPHPHRDRVLVPGTSTIEKIRTHVLRKSNLMKL